jgi:hypothetical protein
MAPASRATHKACGQQKSVGAISKTTSGRQEICRSIAGQLPSEKLAKYRIRFQPRGTRGIQTGQRNTSSMPVDAALGTCFSRLNRRAE